MKDLNKVIYEGIVYVKVADLTLIFEDISLYRIKKEIERQGLETTKLKGFGNGLFISERQASMLVIDEMSVMLSTKVKTINDELKMVQLASTLLNVDEVMIDNSLKHKIEEFDKIEDYVIEDKSNDDDYKEIRQFNENMKKEGLAYRRVRIDMKNTNIYTYSDALQFESKIDVIVDKDMNIYSRPYYSYYAVEGDTLYIDWNETDTDDLCEDFNIHLSAIYGDIEIDEKKIIENIYRSMSESGIKITDMSDWYEIGGIEIEDRALAMLMNKDTLITGISY